jgi:hypothetical protein
MGAESSFACSQKPGPGPYPKPVKSNNSLSTVINEPHLQRLVIQSPLPHAHFPLREPFQRTRTRTMHISQHDSGEVSAPPNFIYRKY